MTPQFVCTKNNLGLVCITTTDDVRFRTITRKRLLSFDEKTQKEMLQDLYKANLERLEKAVEFCLANEINLYRMTSKLFPFSDEKMGLEILDEFSKELLRIGKKALEGGLRLVLHPDQFVVLSSDRAEVIENSIKILKMHAHIMDLLGQPQSEWATMTIHGGKSKRGEKLIETIKNLPENIRFRIALENDEYAYGSDEIAEICEKAGIPMVFDAHHHIVFENLGDYDNESVETAFYKARKTWADEKNQLVHISNGRESFGDRSHHDLIFTMPEVYKNAPWIEVEAKHKEIAIAKLKKEWINS